jgi:hypothetical protein
MIQDVYLIVQPGADRVYVSSSLPESFVKQVEGTKVFNVQVELPGVEKVDGVLRLVGKEVQLREVR